MTRWEVTFYLNVSFMRKDSYQCDSYVTESEKKFIIITHDNLLDWSEAEILSFLYLKHVAQFLYKKLICQHRCFQKLINNEKKKRRQQENF